MAPRPRQPSTPPFRLGLVGIGKIARDQHLPAIAGNPDFTLSATASRNSALSGIPGYKTLAELLDDQPDLDCVALCTPPQPRYDDARLALSQGLHVLLEKPPGATLSEVVDLEDLATRQGCSLFATWHSRFAHAVPAAKTWLADKEIQSISIIWKEDVRRWHPGQDWIWQAGGLGVFDPGINALSILTEIYSGPMYLRDAILEVPENCQTPIAASLNFVGAGGITINADFDWRQTGQQTWDIHIQTGDGTLLLAEGGSKLHLNGALSAEGPDQEYAGIYTAFADLIKDNQRAVDIAPLRHVADAFMLGQRVTVAAFEEDPQ